MLSLAVVSYDLSQGDSLFMRADSICLYTLPWVDDAPEEEAGTKAEVRDSLPARPGADESRSLGLPFGCDFLQQLSDFQSVCDSMTAVSTDSTLHFYIDPVLWNETRWNNGARCTRPCGPPDFGRYRN